MFSGWLQMIQMEVSFLSSTNKSTGALVGSADGVKPHQASAGRHDNRQDARPQHYDCKKWWERTKLSSALPLGGGGGGVGGLGSSGAGASAASADVKQAFALLISRARLQHHIQSSRLAPFLGS